MQAPWKIFHLELNEAIPKLTLPTGYQGVLVIFCWQGIPLGDCNISASELPMNTTQMLDMAVRAIAPAVGSQLLEDGFLGKLSFNGSELVAQKNSDFQQLIELKEPLERLKELWQESSDINENKVSVVICTRDRPKQLQNCLRSLQNLAMAPLEILVVDNAPTSDTTCKIVQEFSSVQYILESRPGLSIARNTGIRHAQGEIIAFTDDDVEVHPQWIANLQQVFKQPQVMAVTGIMLPAQLETEAEITFHQAFNNHLRWRYQALIFDRKFFAHTKAKGVPVWDIGAGANMAFRSKIFQLVGDFNEMLGAGASGCSEDSEMWYRILAEGWECRYEPSAVIYHHHRNNLDSLQQQIYQYMRGHITALLVQFNHHHHWGNLRRTFVVLPKQYLKRLMRKFFRGGWIVDRTLQSEIAGCLAGIKYYWQHRNYLTKIKKTSSVNNIRT